MRTKIAVLASGGGSNLQAILDHFDTLGERRSGQIALVASNRGDAGALERARRRDVPTIVLHGPKQPDGEDLARALEQHQIDLIVLAGYMKLVPVEVVQTYHGRMINIHPALLPAFGGQGMYGSRVHRAVLDAGVKVTGVTAHVVDDEYDRGRIIAQWPVPVFDGDDVESLAARVLRVEHIVYPRVVEAVASGRTTVDNCRVMSTTGPGDVRPSFTLLSHEESRLAENIELALGC